MAQSAEDRKPRTRKIVKRRPRRPTDPVRHTFTLGPRISGILGYFSQTSGKTKSEVVEEALEVKFAGWRICDPRVDASEEKPAA